jgi:uncharacterized protein YbjT (DUF2867 family)
LQFRERHRNRFMVILLTGATGFIGRRLAAVLRAAGHVVIETRRAPADGSAHVAADFSRDIAPGDWIPRLAGVEAVINAVGILRECGEQTFDRVHAQAPRALFAACAAARVRRVVQISALGADSGQTRYFASKRAADEFLATLPLEWTIVQPALVFGEGGTSARLFTLLSSLPITPLPGAGEQRVQPIHIDDLVEAIVRLFGRADVVGRKVALVGPQPLSLREFLLRLRAALGVGRARFVGIPIGVMRAGARAASWLPGSLLDADTLAMLEAGNTGDASMTHRLLQRPPRAVEAFVPAERRNQLAMQGKLTWLLPLLRFTIAAVWLWTGVVSFALYPRASSYDLLARTGAPESLFPLLLYGAAALDIALGAGTLLLRRRRGLWLLQLALIVVYTIIITIKLPEYWLHPYGPVLKNLPMMAAIYLLYETEGTGD